MQAFWPTWSRYFGPSDPGVCSGRLLASFIMATSSYSSVTVGRRLLQPKCGPLLAADAEDVFVAEGLEMTTLPIRRLELRL